jgi:hypothetical protein
MLGVIPIGFARISGGDMQSIFSSEKQSTTTAKGGGLNVGL